MNAQDLAALIAVALKEDIVGIISHEGNVVTVEFTDGVVRKIVVT